MRTIQSKEHPKIYMLVQEIVILLYMTTTPNLFTDRITVELFLTLVEV